jgi:hypothetical protein
MSIRRSSSGSQHRRLVKIGDRSGERPVRLAADQRCGSEHPTLLIGQPSKPRENDLGKRVRHRSWHALAGTSRAGQQLLDDQRNAFRPLDHQLPLCRAQIGKVLFDHDRGVGGTERAQPDVDRGRYAGQVPHHRVTGRVISYGRRHNDARCAKCATEIVQQGNRVRVGPVHVFKHQERSRSADRSEQPQHAFSEHHGRIDD